MLSWHPRLFRNCLAGALCFAWQALRTQAAETTGLAHFHKNVQPLLQHYCYECHGDGMSRGGVAFDELTSNDQILDHELWSKVMKNLRTRIMPPPKAPRPTSAEQKVIEDWAKYEAFGIDPNHPDPGRVTLRRLNRAEYHNTVRDLTGVDFNADAEFPPDDTGYGFDDIGDVLTVSPLLLEKYMNAASVIVDQALLKSTNRSKIRERFLTKSAPDDAAGRRPYAREVLGSFAGKAFRRPVDGKTLDRLVALAGGVYNQPGKTFEAGVAQAMMAVLASPRFIFRSEQAAAASSKETYPLVDEYSLASRLSYFLWSTLPDEELFDLAARGELRKNLEAQVKRMLADPRSEVMVNNFTGQWLQARDVEGIAINSEAVLARDRAKGKGGASQTAVELDGPLRHAMRRETEMVFSSVLHADRSVLELIDSDYTFLNQKLAAAYGLTNLGVTGSEMRRVTLPPDCPRGGVLTEGTVLVVTSNPDRTSPVKRGLFILNNILGSPTPPPPPNVPALEASEKGFHDHEPTLRETLSAHRDQPECAACHSRLDPVGLAFENFNAMGLWREQERGQTIEAGGRLSTGETFQNARELKRVLAVNHQEEFYRCLTEKLLTYATGRGMEYYDTETVDKIVQRLDEEDGRFSALLMGVIESVPFQRERRQANAILSEAPDSSPENPASPNTKRRSTP
jgi:hypothetical protein